MTRHRLSFALLALGSALVIGCSGTPAPPPGESPLATAGGVVEPTATADLPTDAVPTALPTQAPTAAPMPTQAPTSTPTSAPTPTTAPTPVPGGQVLVFRREGNGGGRRNQVDCTDPAFDGTVELRWRIGGSATGVVIAIDGPGAYDSFEGRNGRADVPFACDGNPHIYTLTTTGGPGPHASLARTISPAAPAILAFSVSAADCSGSVGSEMYVAWRVSGANGVELRINGELYATYSTRSAENVPVGKVDCTVQQNQYKLTTIGGYGAPASRTVSFTEAGLELDPVGLVARRIAEVGLATGQLIVARVERRAGPRLGVAEWRDGREGTGRRLEFIV
jgi:hypothetical protein